MVSVSIMWLNFEIIFIRENCASWILLLITRFSFIIILTPCSFSDMIILIIYLEAKFGNEACFNILMGTLFCNALVFKYNRIKGSANHCNPGFDFFNLSVVLISSTICSNLCRIFRLRRVHKMFRGSDYLRVEQNFTIGQSPTVFG